jgi:hypothetical protein
MKPVIDPPSGVARDLYQGTVCCLRCEQKIDQYRLLHQSGARQSRPVILCCLRWGHPEFISDSRSSTKPGIGLA